jgi:hypothetical protein
MNYAVEMVLGFMIYISSFIQIGSAIQKLMWGIHVQKHRQQSDLISLLYFSFQNKESRLNMYILGGLMCSKTV